ncbi:hypothetical protein MCBRY_000525 [Methylocystis bryophila]|uniref:Uncharacterized protein n=1 Tax=Methylocystis bryophila TaxID=655015 RepID=A0A1W6MSM7_9HYPH|nr:hypothetical protein B1812_05205 [Methylocystis bryophila]
MWLVDFEISSNSKQGNHETASSSSPLLRRERLSRESRPFAAHVIFDPFFQTRRRSLSEGRAYNPYAV